MASTLTLPILRRDLVVSTIDLYAGSWDAFEGLHEKIAFVLGAWAPGAVVNADLPFSTRAAAEQAPEKLRVSVRIQVAVGIIAARQGVDAAQALDEFKQAARRAGLTEGAHAEIVIRRAGGRRPA